MTARKTLFVILGILMILAGISCFFTPVETSSVIPFIFGLAMVIDGIVFAHVRPPLKAGFLMFFSSSSAI